MKCRLLITLASIFISIFASFAYSQEPIKLQRLEFSWSHPALKGYQADQCYFLPQIASNVVFVACSFYQSNHAAGLQSCLDFGQSADIIPESRCIPSGLWVGKLNANRTAFEKEWFVPREILAKKGVEKILGSDAQGNLWVKKQGYLPFESTSLLKASTNQSELVFEVVRDFGSQILSMVLGPNANSEIVVLSGGKLRRLSNDGRLLIDTDLENFEGQYVIQDMPVIGSYVPESGPFIKYIGARSQGQIVMIGEGRLGHTDNHIELLACLSSDYKLQYVTLAPRGEKKFYPHDAPFFDVDDNEYRIVALPNGTTKLFRDFNRESDDHQFSFYDINPNCQAVNPTTIKLDADARLNFTVQPIGRKTEFLFIYSVRLHDTIVNHVAKIGAENKIIWDRVIEVPENKGNKYYNNMDVVVDSTGKKVLIVFSNRTELNESSMMRPLFYEMVIE